MKYAVWHFSYSASNTRDVDVLVSKSDDIDDARAVDFFIALRAGLDEFPAEIIAPRELLFVATRAVFLVCVAALRVRPTTSRVRTLYPERDKTARGAVVVVDEREETLPVDLLFTVFVVPRKTASEPRPAANAEHVQIAHITIETTAFFISDNIC